MRSTCLTVSKATLLILPSLLFGSSVLAQEPPPPVPAAAPPVPAANPQNSFTVQGLQVNLGYQGEVKGDNKNSFYYQIKYKGQSLGEHGTAPKQTDITRQFSVPGTDATSDANNFSLNIQQAAGTLKTGTFDGLGIQPIKFAIPALSSLRGSAQASGTLDGKTVNTSVGMETYPILPLDQINRSSGANITNWLMFGLNGEHQSNTAAPSANQSMGMVSNVNQNVGLATYRAFIGKAFGWSYRAPNQPLVALTKVLERADTVVAARKLLGTAGQGQLNQNDPVDQQVAFTVLRGDVVSVSDADPEATNKVFWQDKVQRQLVSYAKGYFQEPSDALWLESSGWYTLSGNPQGSKAKGIYAITLTHWFNSNDQTRPQIQLRYENGFDRAAPTVRENRFIATIGAAF